MFAYLLDVMKTRLNIDEGIEQRKQKSVFAGRFLKRLYSKETILIQLSTFNKHAFGKKRGISTIT